MIVAKDNHFAAGYSVRNYCRRPRRSKRHAGFISSSHSFPGVGPPLTIALLLLRHRIGVAPAVLRGVLQQGHRARVAARATIRYRRIVAIEFATCRSGRTGGASGWTTLGNFRRRELIGVAAGG